MDKDIELDLNQRAINLTDFVSARATELNKFTSILKTKLYNLNKLPFQLLPKHMRRRAMSHNKYRIPSRIRSKVNEEDLLLKKPSVCRKTLRKARLLLSSYARRSARSKWLETHLWHAKRMRMKGYYGYQVAETCLSKSKRAAYRFYKTDTMVYDMSYYFIFELRSKELSTIQTFLQNLVDQTSSEWTQFCKNSSIQNGGRKGYLTLWSGNPRRLLQRCEYIFRPRIAKSQEDYQVWFIMHPSCKDLLTQEIHLYPAPEGLYIKKYEDSFNIFHLVGPTACNKVHWLLQNISNSYYDLKALQEEPLIKAMETVGDPGIYPKGFVLHGVTEQRASAKLISEPKDVIGYQEQSGLEDQELHNEIIVGMAGHDYKPNAKAGNLELWEYDEIPPEDNFSERFKVITRGRYTHKKKDYLKKMEDEAEKKRKPKELRKLGKRGLKQKLREKAADKANNANAKDGEIEVEDIETDNVEKVNKAQQIIDGKNEIEEEKVEQKVQFIPNKKNIEFILIHDEGEKVTGNGAGVKIIVGIGKGLYLWRFLNYLGCKALGMQEYKQVLNERREFIFPQDFPHSHTYLAHRDKLAEERINTYFRKPPAKRINMIKIGSPFAFASEWEKILARSLNTEALAHINPTSLSSLNENLVPVYIKVVRRRYPVDLAMLCIPTEEDLLRINKIEENNTKGSEVIHIEPLGKANFEKPLHKVDTSDYLSKLKEVKPSRVVGGFITSGYLSYRFATGCGKGYILRTILDQLKSAYISKTKNGHKEAPVARDCFEGSIKYNNAYYMLIKNPSSRFYFACKVYTLSQ